jgi:hypothetical protein
VEEIRCLIEKYPSAIEKFARSFHRLKFSEDVGKNMTTLRRSIFAAGYAASLPLCLFLATGCNKQDPAPSTSAGVPTSAGMSKPPGGMPGGPGGGGGQPLAATATGTEIYQAKCGCHGTGGKGGGAPALTASASKTDDALIKIIHDGKGKMPAFASQLSDEQIKKVVATLKEFK